MSPSSARRPAGRPRRGLPLAAAGLLVLLAALARAPSPACGGEPPPDGGVDIEDYERQWVAEKAAKTEKLLRKHRVVRDATGRPLEGEALRRAQAEFDAWEQEAFRLRAQDPRRDAVVEKALAAKGVGGKDYRFTGSHPKESRGAFSDYEVEYATKEAFDRAAAAIKEADPDAVVKSYRIESRKLRYMGWAPGVPRTIDLVGDHEVVLGFDNPTAVQHAKKAAPFLDMPVPTDPLEQEQWAQALTKTLSKANRALDADGKGTYLTPDEARLLAEMKKGRDARGRIRGFGASGEAAVKDLEAFRDRAGALLRRMVADERAQAERTVAAARDASARADAELEAARKQGDPDAIRAKQAAADAARKHASAADRRDRDDRVTLSVLKAKHPRAAQAMGLERPGRSWRSVLRVPGTATLGGDAAPRGSGLGTTLGYATAGVTGYMREYENAERERREVDLRQAGVWSILYANRWSRFVLGVGDALDQNRAYVHQLAVEERRANPDMTWMDDLRLAGKGYAHLLGLTSVQVAQALPSGVGDAVFGFVSACNMASSWGQAYRARADLLLTLDRNRRLNEAVVERFAARVGRPEIRHMRSLLDAATATREDMDWLRSVRRDLEAAFDAVRTRAGDAMEVCERLQEAQGRREAGGPAPPLPDGDALVRQVALVAADARDLSAACDATVAAYGGGTGAFAQVRADAERLAARLPGLLDRWRAADGAVAAVAAAAGFGDPLAAASLEVEAATRQAQGLARFADELVGRWTADDQDLARLRAAFDESQRWLREKVAVYRGSEEVDSTTGRRLREGRDPVVAESAELVALLEEATALRGAWPKPPAAEGGISDIRRLAMGFDGMAKGIVPCDVPPRDAAAEDRDRAAWELLDRLARPVEDMTEAMRAARDAVARLEAVYRALRRYGPSEPEAPAEEGEFGDLDRLSWKDTAKDLTTSDAGTPGRVVLGFRSRGMEEPVIRAGPPPHMVGYARVLEEGTVAVWRDANANQARDPEDTVEQARYWIWAQVGASGYAQRIHPYESDGTSVGLTEHVRRRAREDGLAEETTDIARLTTAGWKAGANGHRWFALRAVHGAATLEMDGWLHLQVEGASSVSRWNDLEKVLAAQPVQPLDSRWYDDTLARGHFLLERCVREAARDGLALARAYQDHAVRRYLFDMVPFLPEAPGYARKSHPDKPNWAASGTYDRDHGVKWARDHFEVYLLAKVSDDSAWTELVADANRDLASRVANECKGDRGVQTPRLPGADEVVYCTATKKSRLSRPGRGQAEECSGTEYFTARVRNALIVVRGYFSGLPRPPDAPCLAAGRAIVERMRRHLEEQARR